MRLSPWLKTLSRRFLADRSTQRRPRGQCRFFPSVVEIESLEDRTLLANSAPGAFTLSNETPTSSSVRLNFTNPGGSPTPVFDVYRNNVLYSSSNTGLTFLNSANLTPGQTYSYYIVMRNSVGSSTSNTINVTIPSANSAPMLVSPGAGSSASEIINDPTPTFTWNAVSGADQYELFISRKNARGSYDLIFSSGSLNGTSMMLPTEILEDGGSYRWNMRSHGVTGWGNPNLDRLYFTMALNQTFRPDLVVEHLVVTPANAFPGEMVNVAFDLRNQGTSVSNAFDSNIRLATSPSHVVVDDLPLVLGLHSQGLQPGESSHVSHNVVIPNSSIPGQQYVWVIADTKSQSGQSLTAVENDKVRVAFRVNTPSPQSASPLVRSPLQQLQQQAFDGDGNDVSLLLTGVLIGEGIEVFAGQSADSMRSLGTFIKDVGEDAWNVGVDLKNAGLATANYVQVVAHEAVQITSTLTQYLTAAALHGYQEIKAIVADVVTPFLNPRDHVVKTYAWDWANNYVAIADLNSPTWDWQNRKTIILTHGWDDRLDLAGGDDEYMIKFAKNFGSSHADHQNYNILAVDWHGDGPYYGLFGSDPNGISSAPIDLISGAIGAIAGASIGFASDGLSGALLGAIEPGSQDARLSAVNGIFDAQVLAGRLKGKLPLENLTLIGHSNGAGFMGSLAEALWDHDKPSKKVAALYALDAPWLTKSYDAVLSSAPFVETVYNYFVPLVPSDAVADTQCDLSLGMGAFMDGGADSNIVNVSLWSRFGDVAHTELPTRFASWDFSSPQPNVLSNSKMWRQPSLDAGLEETSVVDGRREIFDRLLTKTPECYPVWATVFGEKLGNAAKDKILAWGHVFDDKAQAAKSYIADKIISASQFVSNKVSDAWQSARATGAGLIKGVNSAVVQAGEKIDAQLRTLVFQAHSPANASIDVQIPQGAITIGFDLAVTNAGNDDILIVGIGDEVLGVFDLASQQILGAQHVELPLTQHAGQDAILTFYMPSDQHSDAEFFVSNLEFGLVPATPALSSTVVSENLPVGTTVGTLSTSEPDASDVFAYSLVDGTGSADNGLFAIENNVLKTAAVFDYETRKSYQIRIRATNGGGLPAEKQFVISITNVVEPDDLVDLIYSASGSAVLTTSVVNGRLQVKVNNVVDTRFDNFDPTLIRSITITGGAGADSINLTGLLASTYPNLASISLNGGAGNDTIIGSGLNETITGGLGNDSLNGAGGTNTLAESASLDVVLTNASLTGLGKDKLANLQVANLAIASGKGITVSGWTGSGTLTGAGDNLIVASKNRDFTLTNSALQTTDGMSLSLSGFTKAALTGGKGNNAFTMSGWSAAATVTGGSGTDQVIEAGDVDFRFLTQSQAGQGFLDFLTGQPSAQGTLTGIGSHKVVGIESLRLTGGASKNRIDVSAYSGSASLFGEGDDDTLIGAGGPTSLDGGEGNDVLIGGAKSDSLTGGSGRDLLIGGSGADNLNGGAGDDILIGDTSPLTTNAAALTAIMAEWTGANDYATRVNNLSNGGGANASSKLNSTTVKKDTAKDTLTDGDDLDWFFQSGSDVLIDFNVPITELKTAI